LRAFSFYPG